MKARPRPFNVHLMRPTPPNGSVSVRFAAHAGRSHTTTIRWPWSSLVENAIELLSGDTSTPSTFVTNALTTCVGVPPATDTIHGDWTPFCELMNTPRRQSRG